MSASGSKLMAVDKRGSFVISRRQGINPVLYAKRTNDRIVDRRRLIVPGLVPVLSISTL